MAMETVEQHLVKRLVDWLEGKTVERFLVVLQACLVAVVLVERLGWIQLTSLVLKLVETLQGNLEDSLVFLSFVSGPVEHF